jgi:hypothetical protein
MHQTEIVWRYRYRKRLLGAVEERDLVFTEREKALKRSAVANGLLQLPMPIVPFRVGDIGIESVTK